MKLSIKTMLMILIIPASINAEEINYDYLDTNYWSHKLSGQAGIASSTYDGYKVSLSKAISKNIHVLATYIDADKTNGDDVVSKSLGFGINYPMNKKTDFVFEYSHFDVVHSYVSFSSAKTLINSIEAKINHQFSEDLELMAGLIRNDHTSSLILYNGYSASAKYKINENFSIRYEMQSIKDSKVANTADIATNELGISYSF
jgi:hypothetical protein